MKRTITIGTNTQMKAEIGCVFYRGKKIDYLLSLIRGHFGIICGCKYQVTIVEGTKYRFVPSSKEVGYYKLYCGSRMIEYICEEQFAKVFFTPDVDKSYDITVKEVQK